MWEAQGGIFGWVSDSEKVFPTLAGLIMFNAFVMMVQEVGELFG